MPKILVTGGCGFIGANLVQKLHDLGHKVSILDNFSRGTIDNLNSPDLFKIFEADIRDEESVYIASKDQDAIIHLAAYGSVVESVDVPEENFSINVDGTFRVLNAARRAGVKQFVFSSTGGALIGNTTPPVDENSVARPISPYGASKLAAEGYCCAFANSYDMSITALRFANVIGPISWHKKGAVTAFFKAIMKGAPITIYGDGNATRDFLYVDDLCHGIILAMKKKPPHFNVFHLASGKEVSIKQLAETICSVTNSPNHTIQFKHKRKGEVERNFASYELAKSELGFHPKIDFDQALRLTWNWYQRYDSSN